MNERACEQYAEMLVDYADNELAPSQRADVDRHLADCVQCRDRLADLRRSLAAARMVWRDAEVRLAAADVGVKRGTASRARPLRAALIAAGIVLAVSGLLAWRAMTHTAPQRPPLAGPVTPTPVAPRPDAPEEDVQSVLAQIEQHVNEVGASAQLLAAADFLAEQPGGEEAARKQYVFITRLYSDTPAAQKAQSRLASLLERSVVR